MGVFFAEMEHMLIKCITDRRKEPGHLLTRSLVVTMALSNCRLLAFFLLLLFFVLSL